MLNPKFIFDRPDEPRRLAIGAKNGGRGRGRQRRASSSAQIRVRPMRRGEERLALDALKAHPVENVMMMGLVSEHGFENPEHRGTFYGCLSHGRLIAIALIGHHVLLSGSVESIELFAQIARRNYASEIKVVLGEQALASEFCRRLARSTRLCAQQNGRFFLLALTKLEERAKESEHLRLATPDEADAIAIMNISAFEELYGVNPASSDPTGFRQRISARIAADRVWVVSDDAGIAFKAEIVSATDRAVYLEAIITRPDIRGGGLGSQSLRSLCGRLLNRGQSVCLLADADNERTNAFYRNVGFSPVALYHVARY